MEKQANLENPAPQQIQWGQMYLRVEIWFLEMGNELTNHWNVTYRYMDFCKGACREPLGKQRQTKVPCGSAVSCEGWDQMGTIAGQQRIC